MTFARYNCRPRTFDEMLRSTREQTVYAAELGHAPPIHECVVATAEAMFDVFALIAELRDRVEQLEAQNP